MSKPIRITEDVLSDVDKEIVHHFQTHHINVSVPQMVTSLLTEALKARRESRRKVKS
jgi:hypothetical protein